MCPQQRVLVYQGLKKEIKQTKKTNKQTNKQTIKQTNRLKSFRSYSIYGWKN